MTITELELVLSIGFAVMTFMYFKTKGELSFHKRMTMEVINLLAKGEAEVIETETGYELKPTPKAK